MEENTWSMREIIFGDISQYKANEKGEIFTRTLVGSKKRTLCEAWRPIKPHILPKGYLYFTMNGRKGKKTYVHRIIAELFLGKPENIKMDVNHKNCNTSDNRVENLELVTRSENLIHARDNGLLKPNRHLTNEQVKMVKEMLRNGIPPMEIHRITLIPNPTIYKIKNGKNYKREF